MYKTIDTIIIYLTFIILIGSAYLAFTNRWLAKDINVWQMQFIGENKIYPIVTMFCLFVPPMLILLHIKMMIKNKIEKN